MVAVVEFIYYVFLLHQVSSDQFFDSTCLLLGNQLVADLFSHVWHIGLNAWAQQLFHMVRASPHVCFNRVALLPETPSSGCGVEGGQHLPALSFLGAEVTPPVLCSSPESPGLERGVQ